MPDPTTEQQKVLDEPSHCVIVARPGSGKTFTLARKIEGILKSLPDHKGVAAISFTNKASDELKKRCLANGVPRRSSFFGTIDKFFIGEILAFLPSALGKAPVVDFQITRLGELGTEVFDPLLKTRRLEFAPEELAELERLFDRRLLPLDLVGKLGVFVIDRSFACRRYLKARYTHVAIDEYQDSGFEQHQLFLRLKGLGITAIAVGDLDQSIYAFSNRSSEFLAALAQDGGFAPYALTQNHRCHESIVYYSLKLISAAIAATPPAEIRVYEKSVYGSEQEVALWLDKAIPAAQKKFSIEHNSEVAVLFRGHRTGALISKSLKTPHKLFASTPFDEDNSLWGPVFRKVLGLLFDTTTTKFELVEDYLSADFDAKTTKACLVLLRELQEAAAADTSKLSGLLERFVSVAHLIYPRAENRTAIDILHGILDTPASITSFMPAQKTEVQLMTLHKAKGLEFEMVFHLDLHQWILPGFKAVKGDQSEFTQDLNLHYVGVTRAKKCTVLCTSTKRTNSSEQVVNGEPSEFFQRNGSEQCRKRL